MAEMRLQKFLSRAGICSRRKGEEYIKAGWVKVNGKIVTELGVKVDPERDAVEVDSDAIQCDSAPTYIALNKPRGYVSSCHQQNEKIVLDLLDISERVYPVGRLDKDWGATKTGERFTDDGDANPTGKRYADFLQTIPDYFKGREK
jgi:23S rRNA pseudouridine2605 synthase/23S rRNA pseudouridine2604 synthase